MAAAAETPTIFAAASGAGRAAIQVLRISGPASGRLLDALCRTRPPPRHAALRALRCGEAVLDRALVLWLPGPGTYTGEDCAELHLHGGPAVLDAVASALAGLGSRPAEPGEFTRRAFVNGRVDLVQAEAVADLVEAETAAQRLQALDQLQGGLSALCRDWAERIRRIAAFQEALIDFADEALPPGTEAEILQSLTSLHREILAHLARGPQGERLRAGLVFAVVGPPNVGKSSLVNALAARAVAIVSPLPGTTRDAIEVRLDLDGVPVTLVDTAGLRAPQDELEAEGIRRTHTHADAADLVLAVVDASDPGASGGPGLSPGWRVLRIANKLDLLDGTSLDALGGAIAVSARTGLGLDRLRHALAEQAAALTGRGGPARLTRARHREALEAAASGLEEALQAAWPELRAEALRHALGAIGRLTGAVGVEDLLDTVFRSFCIGK